jgi:hypothetical protein
MPVDRLQSIYGIITICPSTLRHCHQGARAVQNDSASAAAGEHTTIAVAPSEPTNDPIRRLLGAPTDPVRRFGLRHWLGLLGLAVVITVAAFVMPSLITPGAPPPTRHPAAAPMWPSQAVSASPPSTATASKPTTPANEPATVVSEPVSAALPGTLSTPKPKAPPKTAKPSAAAPSKTTHKFTSITVQAENASLSNGATKVDCGTCQAGARVRYVGRVDVRVTVPNPGTYDLTVVYEAAGSRVLAVSINGNPPVASRQVTGRDWTTPLTLTVSAALPAGSIDIGLFADTGNAPDIDAVTIS